MNISQFFPLETHKKEFEQLGVNHPLVLSGVSNATSKSYIISALKKQKKFKNIFWITSDNKEIYELNKKPTFLARRKSITFR